MEIYIELLHAIIDHLYLVVTHHPSKNRKQKLKTSQNWQQKKKKIIIIKFSNQTNSLLTF